MTEPYRLRYTNQIVGVFLLIFLLLAIMILLYLIHSEMAKDSYHFIASEKEIGGLNKGASVVILGESVGEVKSIEYVEGSDRIKVNLRIDWRMRGEIFKNSVITLERQYGVGPSKLVIRRPKIIGMKLEPLEEGDRELINLQVQRDKTEELAEKLELVSQSIQRIQKDLSPTLGSFDAAAVRFQGTLENSVDPALDRTEQAADAFVRTNETLRTDVLETSQAIRKLVDQDMREVLVEVRETSDGLSNAAESVRQTSDELNRDLDLTLAQLRAAIVEFHQLNKETREVVRVVGKEANDLPGTADRVNDTVSDTQDLVGEIRSHWLLRRYSQQPTSTPQTSPSGVRGGSVR